MCLICLEAVALIKNGYMKRHYESKPIFKENYHLKSELRSQKIISLRAQYDHSTRILTHSFTGKQRSNECSFRVAWISGQHIKKTTFTDGGVGKESMSA